MPGEGRDNKKALMVLISAWLISQMFFIDKNSFDLGFRPDRVLFFAIVVLFLIGVLRKEIRISSLGGEEICMVIFALLCSVSLLQSGANSDASEANNKWLNALFNITYFPFVTYFIIKRIDYKKHRAKILLIALCGVGGYLGVTGICEHFRIDALVWPKYILDSSLKTHQDDRVTGPFLESVAMGRVLTVTLMCILIMATEYNGIRRTILWVFAMCAAGSIYFTYTRGPWIGFGVALLVILTLQTKMQKSGMLLLVGILLVGISGAGSKLSFFDESTLFTRRQNTVDDRVASYMTALKMGAENPFFGVGFGRFGAEWDNYFTPIPGVTANPETMSHNTFLGILAESGLTALAVFLAILYQLLRMCLVTYRRLSATKPFERSMAALALGVGLMYISTGFVSDLRWNLLQNNIVFLVFGIVASVAGQLPVTRSKTPYGTAPRVSSKPQQ